MVGAAVLCEELAVRIAPSEPLPAPALQFPPRGGAARLASQPFPVPPRR